MNPKRTLGGDDERQAAATHIHNEKLLICSVIKKKIHKR